MPLSILKLAICLLLLMVVPTAAAPPPDGARFPIFPIIEPNVRFWEKIYGVYDSSQGILHDKQNLDIIYTAIDLVDWGTPGASTINRQLIKFSRLRYKKILTNLAKGQKPRSKEEKRIAALFKRNKNPSYHKARDNIRLQVGQKDRFRAGVVRSGAFLPIIKRIFQSHGLPLELAYLPHVESSFNTSAHSKAAAIGLWQFTKSTGESFMTINSVVDERYDTWLSTQAAAKLLKKNYSQLESWPMALTAYNYGRAGMYRAKQKWGTFPRIIQYHKTGIFKFASKNFYAEFIAAVRVARRLESDASLIKDRPWANVTVRLRGYASARDLRQYFNISKEDFVRLNPALLEPVLNGRKYVPKGFLLRLTATRVNRAKINAMPKRLFHSRQKSSISGTYKVKKGDTASTIARKHKVSLKQLARINKLDSKGTVRVGQRLKIPAYNAPAKNSKVIILKATSKRKP